MSDADYEQQGFDASTKAHAQYEAIRADTTLSDEGKAQRMAEVWEKHQATTRELSKADEQQRAADQARIERSLFGSPGAITGSDAIAYRDAHARAAQISSVDEADSQMHIASVSGDDVLERAILLHCVRKGFTQIVASWAEQNPKASTAVQQYLDSHGASRKSARQGQMRRSLAFSARKPQELTKVSPSQLDSWAGRTRDRSWVTS